MFSLGSAAQVLPKLEAVAFFASLVLWWGMVRPSMVRDYDNRRLPSNPTARGLFAFMCVLAYIALVAAFHSASDVAQNIGRAVPFASGLIDNFKDQSPLLAALTFGGLLQIAFIREIERSVLVWAHSARHLHSDGLILASHLLRCDFTPTDDERRRNRDTARRYGVYVTDEALDGLGLVTFNNWRKVAALLRVLREWNDNKRRVLSEGDMLLLDEIEMAHERKTQLAMTIVKIVEQIRKGGDPSKALSDVLKTLAETAHLDRAGVAAMEARVKEMLEGQQAGAADRPVRLSGEELRAQLVQIEVYFQIEYEILLQQTADLVAKSVTLAGEQAPDRLQHLKALGFAGLGRIERINVDRILWIFLAVFVGGFLIMFIGNMNRQGASADGMARFAFAMAIAALIGAIVGSTRRYARADATPWSKYIAGGVVAGAIFLGIQAVTALVKSYLNVPLAPGQQPFSVYRTLPWTMLPLLLTVAVAALARVPRWPAPPGLGAYDRIWERLVDGVCLSGAIMLAFYIAIAMHHLLGLELPRVIQELMKAPHILPLPVLPQLQGFAFFIGFFVLRDVRRAAHARIVEVMPEQSDARPLRALAAAQAARITSL